LLAAQAPFNLGHEVFRQPQVIEGLLKSFRGLLRLAVVTLKALLCCTAATLLGFCVVFGISCVWRHGALLCFVRVFPG
jgi:hypothetical protein